MIPWWNATDGNMFGAIAGGAIGVIGGALGMAVNYLAPRGKAKTFIYSAFGAMGLGGAAALSLGLAALLIRQPRHVWYPLVLGGTLLTVLTACVFPGIRARYRQAELRRLEAEDLRRA